MSKAVKLEQLKMVAQAAQSAAEDAVSGIAIPEYTVQALSSATDGALTTYQLFKNGTAIEGSTINIPKDFLVKSATLETIGAGDTGLYEGAAVGDKYIKFVINSKDAADDTGATPLYLPVNGLVDTYTNGDGLSLTGTSFAVKIDTANSHGLSVTSSGIKLDPATTSTDGAMSSGDKTKLDDLDYATDAEINNVITEVFGASYVPQA